MFPLKVIFLRATLAKEIAPLLLDTVFHSYFTHNTYYHLQLPYLVIKLFIFCFLSPESKLHRTESTSALFASVTLPVSVQSVAHCRCSINDCYINKLIDTFLKIHAFKCLKAHYKPEKFFLRVQRLHSFHHYWASRNSIFQPKGKGPRAGCFSVKSNRQHPGYFSPLG